VWWARVAGQRLEMGGSTSYLAHVDVAGSTTMVTDQAGNVLWDVNFYPWGEWWQQNGSNYWNVFGDLGFQNARDINPGLFRSYQAGLGRWLSPDPLGGDVTNPQSLDRYAYALNNPASNNDPSGLLWRSASPDDVTTVDNVGLLAPQASGHGMPASGNTSGGTMVAQSGLTVRQKGQSFTQCMQQNSNNYSIGGSGELLLDKLFGKSTSVSSNPVVNIFTGNGVSSLLFGTPNDQATSAASYAPHTVGAAMGTTLTWGRRTTDIFDLNLLGKGGVPQALSSGTGGVKSFLGELDNVLSLGMDFTTKLTVDTTLTVDEAIGCSAPSTTSMMVF